MENAKKLLLVDPSRATQLYRPTIKDRKLSQLDENITNILDSHEPEDQKVKRYLTALKQFRYYESPPPVKSEVDEKILDAVAPPQVRTKAKRLLKRIKPQLRLSDDLELVHDKELIENSDISELLSDALTKTASNNPKGWREFADTLKRSRVPRELVTNDKLWRHLNPVSKRAIIKRRWQHF
jgi:hypothetical protein